jgi:hypothetical protein
MILLTRDRNAASIDLNFLGDKRKKKLISLYKKRIEAGGEIPSKKFDSTYWKLSKDRLKIESSEKCAYCECQVPQVAHGDVEHFRPKVKYWWLAYCYDNFLFSCQICNQIYKNDEFPVAGAKLTEPPVDGTLNDDSIIAVLDALTPEPTVSTTALKKFQTYLNKEKAQLPNPYYVDMEKFFVWEEDDVKRTVEMKAKPGKKGAAAFLAAVKQYYGINREELCRLRHAYLRHFKLYKKAVKNNIDAEIVAEAKLMLADMTSASHPFTAMLRYYDKKL